MWTRREDLLIRKHPPEIAARLIARPVADVHDRLIELAGAQKPVYIRPGHTTPRRWTPEEDELVLARPPSEISRLIGRSFRAVCRRRGRLRKKHTGPTPYG
jgi:hypothetical protein